MTCTVMFHVFLGEGQGGIHVQEAGPGGPV